jgi:hypothetical protein
MDITSIACEITAHLRELLADASIPVSLFSCEKQHTLQLTVSLPV